MRINSLNNTKPSFGLITLKSTELTKSQELIKSITKPKLSIKEKNNFALYLYNIFEQYIKNEGMLKAKGNYKIFKKAKKKTIRNQYRRTQISNKRRRII